jgi:hypothetical protein
MCAVVVAGLALSAILYPFSGIHYNVDLAAGVEIAFKKNLLSQTEQEKHVRLCVSLPCGWFNDTQKPVGVLLLSLRNTKSVSPVPCWIVLTFTSKFPEWIMKI